MKISQNNRVTQTTVLINNCMLNFRNIIIDTGGKHMREREFIDKCITIQKLSLSEGNYKYKQPTPI